MNVSKYIYIYLCPHISTTYCPIFLGLIRQGTGYIDDGVVCQDAEDGLITNVLPDSEESLGLMVGSPI